MTHSYHTANELPEPLVQKILAALDAGDEARVILYIPPRHTREQTNAILEVFDAVFPTNAPA